MTKKITPADVALEAGQLWRTRDLRCVRLEENKGMSRPHFPFMAKFEDTGRICCMRADGHALGVGVTTRDDLIELVEDAEGFMPWFGGEMPVPRGTIVDAKMRVGHMTGQREAEKLEWGWGKGHDLGDIIGYRICEEAAQPTEPVAEDGEEDAPESEPSAEYWAGFEAGAEKAHQEAEDGEHGGECPLHAQMAAQRRHEIILALIRETTEFLSTNIRDGDYGKKIRKMADDILAEPEAVAVTRGTV